MPESNLYDRFFTKMSCGFLKQQHLNWKPKAMTTNQILTASFLDILFENRNKEYGAYVIRKEYPQNLMKALGIMLVFVSTLSIYSLTKPVKPLVKITPYYIKPDHVLESIKDTEKPKEPQQQRSVPKQPPTKLDRTIVIVDNPDTSKLSPDRTDSARYNPGNFNKPGMGDDPDYVPGVITNKPIIPNQPGASIQTPREPAILDNSEIAPEFPGGTAAWLSYLQKMLRTPDDLETGNRKTVRVKFVVNADGDITDAVIIQSAGFSFDKEVLRVINRMPKWKPGKQGGKPVAVYFIQPVTFETISD